MAVSLWHWSAWEARGGALALVGVAWWRAADGGGVLMGAVGQPLIARSQNSELFAGCPARGPRVGVIPERATRNKLRPDTARRRPLSRRRDTANP